MGDRGIMVAPVGERNFSHINSVAKRVLAVSSGIRQLGPETDHMPSSGAEA
jgi:hypothetical protein